MCAKFDVSSFTRYKIREGVPKFKNSTQVPHHTHFWGNFVIHEMGNTKIYPYTKFEVSIAFVRGNCCVCVMVRSLPWYMHSENRRDKL